MNSDFSFNSQWGGTGVGDGQFYSPRGIAIDSSNNIYVSDEQNYRIQKFTSSGTFIGCLGGNTPGWQNPCSNYTSGSGDVQFMGPYGIDIDSQGNICPCDFTMMSFGNLHDKPIREIWKETSENFCIPGCSCYANICNDAVYEKRKQSENSGEWPLRKRAAKEILEECPSYSTDKIPEFYKRMDFKKN